MKIKDIECHPEDIGKLNAVVNLDAYLGVGKGHKIMGYQLIFLGILITVILFLLWTIDFGVTVRKGLLLIIAFLGGVKIILLHLKYKNSFISLFSAIALMALIGVCTNTISGEDILNKSLEKAYDKL